MAPEALVDSKASSPVQEMAHGFLWRLTCDAILATTGTAEAQKHLSTFLSHGKTAITASSYFGDHIPSPFCPNFAYHFTVIARWPTHIDPLADLSKLLMVSERALEYAPIVVNLHIAMHLPLTLITCDRQLSENHRRTTPRYSYPDLTDTESVLDLGREAALAPAPVIPQVATHSILSDASYAGIHRRVVAGLSTAMACHPR